MYGDTVVNSDNTISTQIKKGKVYYVSYFSENLRFPNRFIERVFMVIYTLPTYLFT